MVAVIKSGTPQFRRLKPEDAEIILKIEEKVYEYPWTLGIFNDCIRVSYECTALELEQELIGYAIMTIGASESHLLNIGIHPDYQGQGFGRLLLESMLDKARRSHAKTTFLEVRASNSRAIHLYESMGFNEIGIRHNYYPGSDRREDGVIFAIEI